MLTVAVPHRPSVGGGPLVIGRAGVPKPIVTRTQDPAGAGHHVVAAPHSHADLPMHVPNSLWQSEMVEPVIHGQRVEFYRTNDAREVLYQDVMPMDKKGFHLVVFGTRRPSYQALQK